MPLHERQRYLPSIHPFFQDFNSCLYMRGNIYWIPLYPGIRLFQFMPLHERQRFLWPPVPANNYFNSCLYMRGNKMIGFDYLAEEFQFMPLHERQPVVHHDATGHYEFQFMPLHERQQQKYTIFSIKST